MMALVSQMACVYARHVPKISVRIRYLRMARLGMGNAS